MDKYGTSQTLHLTTQGVQEVSLESPAESCLCPPHARHADYDMQYYISTLDATPQNPTPQSTPSIIKEGLPSNSFKGILDTSTITEAWSKSLEDETPKAAPNSFSEKPPLESLINAKDFELTARNTSTPKT